MTIDIQFLKENNCLLFDAISGSHAYGTNIPSSDIDHKGVFILPREYFYGLNYIPQVSDERNDKVYYELGRFMELLLKNNPNMMELLAMPEECVLYEHPLFEQIKSINFLSKTCFHTFAGYAISQIKKARGLNKKIANPMPKERKTILDFCYILKDHGAVPLEGWLAANNYNQLQCGLVNVPHFKDTYALFYDETGNLKYKGIMPKETSNQVALSSIPKGEKKRAILSFNLDGYKTYCKTYSEYWSWVALRNEARYENTKSHGKNYDTKNMMHTFRLLDMAEDIFTQQKIIVRRPNRAFLLDIRKGKFEYEDLLNQAEEKINHIQALYEKSNLAEQVNLALVNSTLIRIREQWYHQ